MLSIHIDNDMNINMHIEINMNIGRPQTGQGWQNRGGGRGPKGEGNSKGQRRDSQQGWFSISDKTSFWDTRRVL